MKKRKYSGEFKSEAIKMALESNEPYANTAKKLGISKSLLYSWMKSENQPEEIKGGVRTILIGNGFLCIRKYVR